MRYAVALIGTVLLAGCNGGTVDRHALTNDASAIKSINCESWLVARAVARGRVTSTYAREQAEELRLQAANLADALGQRPTEAGLKPKVRAAGRDAGTLAQRLQLLRDHPSSGATADALAQRFRRAGECS
jgi:hypothetical protein